MTWAKTALASLPSIASQHQTRWQCLVIRLVRGHFDQIRGLRFILRLWIHPDSNSKSVFACMLLMTRCTQQCKNQDSLTVRKRRLKKIQIWFTMSIRGSKQVQGWIVHWGNNIPWPCPVQFLLSFFEYVATIALLFQSVLYDRQTNPLVHWRGCCSSQVHLSWAETFIKGVPLQENSADHRINSRYLSPCFLPHALLTMWV